MWQPSYRIQFTKKFVVMHYCSLVSMCPGQLYTKKLSVSSLKCNKILLAQGILDRCQTGPSICFYSVYCTREQKGWSKTMCLHCWCAGKHLHFLHDEVASNTATQTSRYLPRALVPGEQMSWDFVLTSRIPIFECGVTLVFKTVLQNGSLQCPSWQTAAVWNCSFRIKERHC